MPTTLLQTAFKARGLSLLCGALISQLLLGASTDVSASEANSQHSEGLAEPAVQVWMSQDEETPYLCLYKTTSSETYGPHHIPAKEHDSSNDEDIAPLKPLHRRALDIAAFHHWLADIQLEESNEFKEQGWLTTLGAAASGAYIFETGHATWKALANHASKKELKKALGHKLPYAILASVYLAHAGVEADHAQHFYREAQTDAALLAFLLQIEDQTLVNLPETLHHRLIELVRIAPFSTYLVDQRCPTMLL